MARFRLNYPDKNQPTNHLQSSLLVPPHMMVIRSLDWQVPGEISRGNILRPSNDYYHGDKHCSSYCNWKRFEKIVSTALLFDWVFANLFREWELSKATEFEKIKYFRIFFYYLLRFSLHSSLKRLEPFHYTYLSFSSILLIFSRQSRPSSSVSPPD